MSAPMTNIERQKRRHGGVLKWLAIATGFAALLFLGFLAIATNGDEEKAVTETPAATVAGD